LTSAPVIELFLICFPVMSALPAAIAVPPIATNNASIATTIAGDWRTRRASSFLN
jgi:hypothetical protein